MFNLFEKKPPNIKEGDTYIEQVETFEGTTYTPKLCEYHDNGYLLGSKLSRNGYPQEFTEPAWSLYYKDGGCDEKFYTLEEAQRAIDSYLVRSKRVVTIIKYP